MKLVHLSDLHLGKRVNEFSMIEDQEYILIQIINRIDEIKPDAVIVAGDIYDKSVPSEEAVRLWDDFLSKLAKRKLEVYAISGNHDSAVRFAQNSRIIDQAGIHLSPAYDGKLMHFTILDEYSEKSGDVNLYMLPFIKPAVVRSFYPEEDIKDYTDAVRVALEHADGSIDPTKRNILVAHQFVTGAERCESEEITVGGLDNVDASVFDDFDYVALGHIHGPQKVKRDTIRYSGTPLKYSFSEKDHHKSLTVVTVKEKGKVQIELVPFEPLRDLRQIRGTYEELSDKRNYEGTRREDYIHAILTDEEDIPDAISKLRIIYPNLMKLTYDNTRTRENKVIEGATDIERKSPIELFEEFYEKQNNQEMSDEQRELVSGLIESIWNK
ncbi:exonuclease SbcCD subunit D [Butyrivibrio sp. INlla14]|uniref:exonuclease SbcCD subunit D n=1 Tax=Butyrivibrio sp. INlla14 TaxID=1520808 RepID=UPI000876B14D|nr:exonuclease SbcCD subunit D [Butyrivibrio sp. INlla14]SCY39828.1 Exodeoxyribonuclease I subunit D [Butyrivibrio sp. INlla14]